MTDAVRAAGRMAGRKLLVVGGGTRASDDPEAPMGNGRAIAVAAAREGAAVAVTDVSEAAAEETARLVRNQGRHGVALRSDAADPDACIEAVVWAAEQMGGLDALVLNVGIGLGRRLGGTSVEEWDAAMDVNVRAHFLILKEALPRMGAGSATVLISSVAGLRAGSQIPSYDTSKAAQLALMRHAAWEAAPQGGRVNAVCPGLIDTPLGRLTTAGRPSRAATPVPLGRQGSPMEVAAAVIFLLSDDASYVTGQVLAVDGGLSTLG